jgi:MYCBP-associated protein family
VRDVHTLAAWEAQRERWQRLRERLSARKKTAGLAMERGEEARLRVEQILMAELAQPLEERFGSAAWAASLRDNFELRSEHPPLAGTPQSGGEPEPLVGMRSLSHASANRLGCVRSNPVSAASMASEAALLGGAPSLCVEGKGLLRRTRELAASTPTLPELVRFMAAHCDPLCARRVEKAAVTADAAAAQSRRESMLTDAPLSAEEETDCIRISVSSSPAGSHPSEVDRPPMPSLQCCPQQLTFHGHLSPTPAGSTSAVTLTNSGSLALYFAWAFADSCAGGGDDDADPQFESVGYGVDGTAPRAALLPGESRTTWFRYAPSTATPAREIWALRTAPPLQAEVAVMLEGEC